MAVASSRATHCFAYLSRVSRLKSQGPLGPARPSAFSWPLSIARWICSTESSPRYAAEHAGLNHVGTPFRTGGFFTATKRRRGVSCGGGESAPAMGDAAVPVTWA